MTIRLLIAEDHDLVREGLRITFEETEIDVIGEATTGSDAVRLASRNGADVMLLDIKMPGGDGFDVLQQVKSANPKLAVLIYSQHERPDFQDRARSLGASGYLTKRARAEELIDAVRKASQGKDLWG
jgi:DNA-binding NarL/FixJ family response regulator